MANERGTRRAPFGSITDVAGITVGHTDVVGDGWATGTTVVFAPNGAIAAVDVRGGGPGTRETDALDPSHLVETIHAICLTGGSAFGLAAADGVMGWLEEQGLGFPIDEEHVVPVVPAAVIFDLGRGGDFSARPDATFGRAAVDNASAQRAPAWGALGAGTGARTAGLQGGVGTASAQLDGITVGALAVVNAAGSPIDRATGKLWCAPHDAPALSDDERNAVFAATAPPEPPDADQARSLNTTIGVVATTARLSPAECAKFAAVAHDGLARALRPAHSMFDGDTVFGMATGVAELPDVPPRFRGAATRAGVFNQLLTAAADTFADACMHAVLAAESVGDAAAYRELAPSTAAWFDA